jgi:hypothetical protein
MGSMEPTLHGHPPTSPGPVPQHVRLPINRMAVAALACGVAGVILPAVNIAAIVLGTRALKRIGPGQQGQSCAIIGIVLGVLGILANVASTRCAASCGRPTRSSSSPPSSGAATATTSPAWRWKARWTFTCSR